MTDWEHYGATVHWSEQYWQGQKVIIFEWDCEGKHHRVPLVATNGRRWTPKRTVTKAQQEFVSAMIGHKASQAETKAYYAAPENQKLIAALEGNSGLEE